MSEDVSRVLVESTPMKCAVSLWLDRFECLQYFAALVYHKQKTVGLGDSLTSYIVSFKVVVIVVVA